MEPPGYDPRGLKSMALSYAVASRGACHLRSTSYILDLAGELDRKKMTTETAFKVIDLEERFSIMDSLILCRFLSAILDWETLTKAVNIVTRKKLKTSEVREIGRKINLLVREINVREGIDILDDKLPNRFYEEPLVTRKKEIFVVKKEEFNAALKNYYKLMGLTERGTLPRKPKTKTKKT